MSEIKLKPCPFCGNENVRLMSNETEDGSPCCINSDEELEAKYCYIHCYGCDMDFMPDSDIAKDVMEAWNRRTDEKNDGDLISRKALLEEVKKYRDIKFSNTGTRYALSYVIGLINNYPTAFNKEKVIKELRQEALYELGIPEEKFNYDEGEYSSYCSISFSQAKRIVKKGGV